MSRFEHHFLMKPEDVKQYIVEIVGYFEADEILSVSEIGDGNINYVFRVEASSSQKSVVVKQSDVLLRSSGRPLDVGRNKIEADILKIQHQLAGDYVPEVYYYDSKMHVIVMEDISAYQNLRKQLMQARIFPKLAADITNFMVDSLLPMTDLVLSPAEKKRQVGRFINIELCDITEDLVFTEPYYNYKQRNLVIEPNQQFVEQLLYHNQALKAQVLKLRDSFMNHAQSLLHGDLHSGSIFINQQGLKVIDPEFGFYGPIGYDLGNVIANLFFSLGYAYFTNPLNKNFIDWIGQTIAEVYDQFEQKMDRKYEELVTFEFCRNPYFQQYYIEQIMIDCVGYAGTELIRRIVGDAKVAEVEALTDTKTRIKYERSLLRLGVDFIMKSDKVSSGAELVDCFYQVLEGIS